ncbi:MULTISPECIES: hypothetical protein [unclassified Mesorhizobium]|uniref:hypothetical protein n=1 Tax=unclassified Mesorhizobium TaxID=325217 RepID=UPI000FCBB945|nr:MULTISPECIES: hypothetical protein [unclassified Mesorhizobium]RUX92273.1 hypothetical protein EN993_23895 [Mesorhizobium sp. M7D.F.Ca.US.004.01.2.1]RVA24818.1 hypothetical protein EN935_25455 [Mesorhizobium sp. M7D.F.Ca.US.004.03.1.1]
MNHPQQLCQCCFDSHAFCSASVERPGTEGRWNVDRGSVPVPTLKGCIIAVNISLIANIRAKLGSVLAAAAAVAGKQYAPSRQGSAYAGNGRECANSLVRKAVHNPNLLRLRLPGKRIGKEEVGVKKSYKINLSDRKYGGEGGIPFHLYDTENTSLFALFVTQFVTQLQLRFITALSSQLLGSPAQSIRSVETDGL